MAATVKSLEERTDEMADDIAILKGDVAVLKSDVAVLKNDVAILKSDVAVLKGDMAAVKGDVAVLKGDMGAVKGDMGAVKEKLERGAQDFALFKGKLEATLGMLRWIGAFSAGVLVMVIFSVINVSHTAGKLESSLLEQELMSKEQSRQIHEMSLQLTEIRSLLKKNP